jgi:hypothetical protein
MYHRRHLLEKVLKLAPEHEGGTPWVKSTTSVTTEAQLDLRPELGQVRQRLLEILGAIPLELIGEYWADTRPGLMSSSHQFHCSRIQASFHYIDIAGRSGRLPV